VKNVVVHLSKCNPNSTTASVRIAKFLCDQLQAPLVDRPEQVELTGVHDNVFIVNAPSAFCPIIDELVEMCKVAKRLVWVMNDYTIYPPTQLRNALWDQGERRMETWGTVPTLSDQLAARWTYRNLPKEATHYIDWNALTYAPLDLVMPAVKGLFYYGAFRVMPSGRQCRREAFEKYLDTDLYPVRISTSKKQIEKFEELCPKAAEVVGPTQDLLHTLARHQASLYIEDGASHGMYCSPANRFYEMVSSGCLMLVDKDSVHTLTRAGITIDKAWIVGGPEDVARCLEAYGFDQQMRQAKELRQDYFTDRLMKPLKEAMVTL
jgi:hypothetical protein